MMIAKSDSSLDGLDSRAVHAAISRIFIPHGTSWMVLKPYWKNICSTIIRTTISELLPSAIKHVQENLELTIGIDVPSFSCIEGIWACVSAMWLLRRIGLLNAVQLFSTGR
jgi:hypothetical protein